MLFKEMYFSYISKYLLSKSHRISKHTVKCFWILAFASHTTHEAKENQCGEQLPAIPSQMREWAPPEKNSSSLRNRDPRAEKQELWGHLAHCLPPLPEFIFSHGYAINKHELVDLLSKYVGLIASSCYLIFIQPYKIYNMEKNPGRQFGFLFFQFVFVLCFFLHAG